ncbi:MAG TPA: hypothetical protein VN830_04650 [Verrucomicrobiae bacterium]|nr:hypothetical protein [Verrucomicrobiae bacterium]
MSEFYIGYLPNAPRAICQRVRLAVLAIFVLTAAGALLFAASQSDFADSNFDFGKPSEFAGIIIQQPFPSLLVADPANPGGPATWYLLCASGKQGADTLIEGFTGENVRLNGTLIHREEGRMIELIPGSLSTVSVAPARSAATRNRGEFTLRGEIVDTKCFLGVMNPGDGKVHRDCAARCLSGGIPPALLTSDLDGSSKILLLTNSVGQPLPKSAFLQLVGQPVRVRGRVLESDGLYYLRASPEAVEALP